MAKSNTKAMASDIRGSLLQVLREVDRPGKFCTSGDQPVTMPGLQVEGIGPIGLPLTKAQARKLIKLCRQAPYGKGTQTVVDTEVRRVWELDADRFELINPDWEGFIVSVMANVKQELGLEKQKLVAHLYKLLVYETGSFFLPHRDGEKLDGMVASLVVALPSVHQGGELIVSHDGQEETLPMSGAASGLQLSYAAFYADCEHEVRPVLGGYRLCLAYNLTLAKSRGGKGVGAPSYGETTKKALHILGDLGPGVGPHKLAVTLDHRYTQDGLTVDRLKGIDRARANVLFEAAEQAGCVAHLALITLWRSGSAEGGYDDYSYGRRRRSYWSGHDDEYEVRSGAVSKRVMGEVYDENLSADHWSDRHGTKVSLGGIQLDESEVVSDAPPEDWEASREEFEGYTGNAGMTLDRWYHRAAIVIWPRARHFEVLCEAGTDASIGGLQSMVKSLKRTAKSRRDAQRQECTTFAGAIIESWEPSHRRSWSAEKPTTAAIDRDIFPALLCELDDADLVRRFLSNIMTRDGGVQLDGSFVKFCKAHGWESFETELAKVMQAATLETIPRNARLARLLCVQRDKNPERIGVCTRLCEQAVDALIRFDRTTTASKWQLRQLDRGEILTSLVDAMLAIGADEPLRNLIDHTWAATEKYDLSDVHLAAIFRLEKRLKKSSARSAAVSHWLELCEEELASRTANPPQPPADFRRKHKLSCTCANCRTLSAFLGDPDEEQLRLPLAKPQRHHLHEVIDGQGLDLTHVTERSGRPYTLVCTKTSASYAAARKIHDRDLKHLERIRRLLEEMR